MKCRECDCCCYAWFPSKPNDYVCIGVKEPFVIDNINVECTEYESNKNIIIDDLVPVTISKAEYEDLLEYKRMYEDVIKARLNNNIIQNIIDDVLKD